MNMLYNFSQGFIFQLLGIGHGQLHHSSFNSSCYNCTHLKWPAKHAARDKQSWDVNMHSRPQGVMTVLIEEEQTFVEKNAYMYSAKLKAKGTRRKACIQKVCPQTTKQCYQCAFPGLGITRTVCCWNSAQALGQIRRDTKPRQANIRNCSLSWTLLSCNSVQ